MSLIKHVTATTYPDLASLCEAIKEHPGVYTDCTTQPEASFPSRYAHRTVGSGQVQVILNAGRPGYPDLQATLVVSDQESYDLMLEALERAGARFNDTHAE